MRVRNLLFISVAGLAAIACLALTACGVIPDSQRIVVMTYNTQAFFDATTTGSEFAEYRKTGSPWNAERYSARLDRLREVILLAGRSSSAGDRGPDIVVLQEIENDGVVRDLCNRLPPRCRYPYAAFAPPGDGSAFSSAVLSRFPITTVRSHTVGNVDISLRPLLEVALEVDGVPLTVFAAHWKSKSGDSDTAGSTGSESGAVRAMQEAVLATCIAECESARPRRAWLACGDFNQPLDAFSRLSPAMSCWPLWLGDSANSIDSDKPRPAGSYYFRGKWETIDHIFLSASAQPSAPALTPVGVGSSDQGISPFVVSRFFVLAEPPLVGDDFVPVKYELFSGRGYSDHLPLVVELERRE